MRKFYLKTLLIACTMLMSVSSVWADAPVSGSDYLIKNVQTGYYLVGGIEWGSHACLHKMPQWFTFIGSNNVYTLDSHQYNNSTDHFLGTNLYVDAATADWTVAETATPGVFTISNGGNYLAGNGVDAAITTTTDATAAAAQWKLISYSDFVSSLSGVIDENGVDATPYIKDPELKRNGNFTTWSGTKPWIITGFNGSGAPSNFSEGQDKNNASCAESYRSANGFKAVQTLTGLKPGQYKLTAQAFYRQDGEDVENYPYLFVGDAKSYFPVRTGTENNMPDAYASFLSNTYPVEPITFIVSSESDNITIGYANANVTMWNIFGQTQLTYYGTALINDAIPFNNGGVMTAGQWYYFDATVAGTYEFSAGSDLTAISYTTDGTQVTSSATGATLTASQALSATRYYFKSSSAQTLTVDVPTGAQIVNADIDFSSATTSNETVLEGSVFNGTLNSITIGQGQFRESQAGWLSLDDATSTITIPSAQRAGSRDIVKVQFKRAWGNKNGMGSGISLKDADGEAVFNFTFARWGGGANNANINMDGLLGAHNSNVPMKERYTLFDITIDYASNTITSYVECVNTDGKGTHKSETFNATLTNTNPIATFNAWGYNVGGNKDRADIINDIKITTTKGDYSVSEVGYTVKFVDGNGTKVKEDVTDRESVAGTAISTLATSDDQTTFYNDGDIANNNTAEFAGATNKYVYKNISAVNSSDEPITELEAGAIVTIVYDKYNKYDYAVKQKIGDAAATDKATGSLWEDQTYSYYFPKGVKSDNKYYFTEANLASPYYRGTLTSSSPTVTINYTLDPTVVFYSEGEDLESKTGTYTHYPDLMSNGSCGILNAEGGNLVYNLPAGIYTITARTVGRGDGDRKIYFYKSSVDDANKLLTATPNYTSGSTETSSAFTLTEATDILVKGADGGGANGKGLDWVYIQKVADYIVAKTSSANLQGYKTFYNANANYEVDENTTIYIAKSANSEKIVLSSVEGKIIPKGTPVILKTTNTSDYNLTLTWTSTASEDNFTENILAAANGTESNVYILAYTTANGLGFYKYTSTLDAGDVYLDIPATTKSRLEIVIDGDVTGIGNIAVENISNGALFNVAGQRVDANYKGVIIKNGKKYYNK